MLGGRGDGPLQTTNRSTRIAQVYFIVHSCENFIKKMEMMSPAVVSATYLPFFKVYCFCWQK
jgi:hypothetical protein